MLLFPIKLNEFHSMYVCNIEWRGFGREWLVDVKPVVIVLKGLMGFDEVYEILCSYSPGVIP